MNYRRSIVDSEEYKELINSIDKKMEDYRENIFKLKNEESELLKVINNNEESVSKAWKKIYNIQNEIIENIRNDQRIKDTIMCFIPGLIATSLMLTGANISTGTDPTILYSIGGGVGVLSFVTSALIYASPNHIIKSETIEKSMKKEKNAKLKEKKESYNLERAKKFEQLEKDYKKYEDIKNEIHKNIQEAYKLQKEKEKIITIAKNYDNINDYQKILAPAVKKKYNEAKHLAKVLKKGNI